MATHMYGYASICPGWTIKIPARADTSGIIRSSKQDCPDDSDFRGPPPFVSAPFVLALRTVVTRPFLVGRSRCGQSRKGPSNPKRIAEVIVLNPFYVKTLTSFVSAISYASLNLNLCSLNLLRHIVIARKLVFDS